MIYRCKRWKPQPERNICEIYKDPYNKKFKQYGTACNDGLFNGGNPFATLFNLHNVDDKAIVPSLLSKKHKINWEITNEKTNYQVVFYLIQRVNMNLQGNMQ